MLLQYRQWRRLTITMQIGERIKTIREFHDVTQAKLAEQINVTPSFISRIENGSSMPSLEYIHSIAKALNVPPQDILCDMFTYEDYDLSISDKVKITVEKFPVERQQEFLEILEFLASRLK